METIPLRTLELVTFDKNNPRHIAFLKHLVKDKSILKWFQGISAGLLHNFGDTFFDHGFFASIEGNLIGYIHVGAFNREEGSVYLRYAISNDERGKGYGKLLLLEATEYIFNSYPEVESMRLKIDNRNTASLNTALSCNYKWLVNDFYVSYNPNLEVSNDIMKK